MSLFEKPTISELVAAALFVNTLAETAKRDWPAISRKLDKFLSPTDSHFQQIESGDFEFLLATVAVQLQALPNLLPKPQAARVRERVLAAMSTPELGAYPREAIREYQAAWDEALAKPDLPWNAVASVLFDKLGCTNTVEIMGETFKHPFLISALAQELVKFCGGWWKELIDSGRLVP